MKRPSNVIYYKYHIILFFFQFRLFFEVSCVDNHNNFYHKLFIVSKILIFHFIKTTVSSPLNVKSMIGR